MDAYGCMKCFKTKLNGGVGVIIFCGITLLFAACSPVHTVTKPEKPMRLLRIDKGQNGAAIILKRGEVLRVTLPGDLKSGYFWEVEQVDKNVLVEAGHAVFVPNLDPAVPGGVFCFTFSGADTGITPLRIVYRHAHKGDNIPLKVFLVLVTSAAE